MRLDSMDYFCCPACKGEFRLKIDKQTEAEVVQGILECLACQRHFEIKDGLPNLTFPEILAESDFQNKIYHDQNTEYDGRPWVFHLSIWVSLWGTRARRQLIDKLEHFFLKNKTTNGFKSLFVSDHYRFCIEI